MTNPTMLQSSIEIILNNIFKSQTVSKYYTQSKQDKILFQLLLKG